MHECTIPAVRPKLCFVASVVILINAYSIAVQNLSVVSVLHILQELAEVILFT